MDNYQGEGRFGKSNRSCATKNKYFEGKIDRRTGKIITPGH